MAAETIAAIVVPIVSGLAGLIFWLARRDRVAVVDHEVYPEFLPKGAREEMKGFGQSVTLSCHTLAIEARCDLVLTSGPKELEVAGVKVILDKAACERLRKHFHPPFSNWIRLPNEDPVTGQPPTCTGILKLKKREHFEHKVWQDCTDDFERIYEEVGNGPLPSSIKPLMATLEEKYQIWWTRYDDKQLCWRFPDRWYRNLGKKIWGV